jgi:hypothetical protein
LPSGINLNRQRELRSFIPHIADALIDRPNLQVRIQAWLEHRQQFIIGRRLFSEPPRPILLCQDDRHFPDDRVLLQRFRRVVGKRLIVAEGRIVTAYHASKACQRQTLRNAHECEFYD